MKKILYILIGLFLFSCGGKSWQRNTVDILLDKYQNRPGTEILLSDMEVSRSGKLRHQYSVIGKDQQGKYKELERVTDRKVTEGFFALHYDNLGMSVGRIDSLGNKSTIVAPPGFNTVIGNPNYGEFREENGRRVWHFFPAYLYYSTLFNYGNRMIYYNNYNNYYRHYRNNRPYYGSAGASTSYWGTKSTATKSTHKNFYKRSTYRSGNWRKSYSSSRSRGGGGFGK